MMMIIWWMTRWEDHSTSVVINDCSHFRVNHVTEFNQNRNWLRINPEQGFDEEKPLQAPQDTKKESIKLSLAINRVPPILNPAISRLKLVLPRSRLPGNGSVKPDLIATTSAKRARRRCRPAPSSSGRSEFLIIDVNFCSEIPFEPPTPNTPPSASFWAESVEISVARFHLTRWGKSRWLSAPHRSTFFVTYAK